MEVIAIAGAIVGATGFLFGFLFALRLYRWEKQLRGARVAVAYKNRVKMQPTLLDLLDWSHKLAKDKRNTGQAFFKMGGVTIAILKPLPRAHGKTTTRTTKEAA